MSTLLNPPSHSPSSTARGINVLFFISLILSLAAALFSILARQWIREYLKWRSPLSEPRKNVIVRQIRYQAWEDWQVDAVIWSIPVLLEIAMVLFLLGFTVLLWTLDDAVAATITAFVVLFLLALFGFTLLPLLSRRSPYKSPVSWVFLRCFWELRDIFLTVLGRSRSHYVRSSARELQRDLGSMKAWRDRDLDSLKATNFLGVSWPRCSSGALESIIQEISKENTPLGVNGNFRWELASRQDPQASGQFSVILQAVQEVPILVQALSWVERASYNVNMENYIDDCIETMFSSYYLSLTKPDVELRLQIQTITIWCLLISMKNTNHLRSGYQVLCGDSYQSSARHMESSSQHISSITEARKALMNVTSSSSSQQAIPSLQSLWRRADSLQVGGVLAHMAVAAVSFGLASVSRDKMYVTRRMHEMLLLLKYSGDVGAVSKYLQMIGRTPHCHTFTALTSNASTGPAHVIKYHIPGFSFAAFECACKYAKVSAEDSNDALGESQSFRIITFKHLIVFSGKK